MLEILQPGLETSIQDYPGRIGYWNPGVPPSGPMAVWSFRLANILGGNDPGAAGLECQFMGPTIKFRRDGVIAVCGADMSPRLDGQAVPLWESVTVKSGQTLALSFGKIGARAYLAVARGVGEAGPQGEGGLPAAIRDRQALEHRGGPRPQRRLDRRGGSQAFPRERLEAVLEERPHRFPPRGAAVDLRGEGPYQGPRARRRAVQYHRPGLSLGRDQSGRPDADHPGQRWPQHGRLHQSLYGAVGGVLEARAVEAGGHLP